MNISRTKIQEGSLLEIMRLAYCLDKQSFVKAFDEIGLPVENEDSLVVLNDWHEKKFDVDGIIKNVNNENLTFNMRDFVNYNIKINHSEINKCDAVFTD